MENINESNRIGTRYYVIFDHLLFLNYSCLVWKMQYSLIETHVHIFTRKKSCNEHFDSNNFTAIV